jgi:hypothetical protein
MKGSPAADPGSILTQQDVKITPAATERDALSPSVAVSIEGVSLGPTPVFIESAQRQHHRPKVSLLTFVSSFTLSPCDPFVSLFTGSLTRM